jgi:uncharacterized Zn-finger protein
MTSTAVEVLPQMRFLCPVPECPRTFASNFNLQRHFREHHLSTTRLRISCSWPACDDSFTTLHNMRRHVQSVHGGAAVRCVDENCPARFHDKEAMQQHLQNTGASTIKLRPFNPAPRPLAYKRHACRGAERVDHH